MDLQSDAQAAAEAGMSGAVKSAHAIAIADLKGFPTVTELATYVQGEGVAVATDGSGIDVDINGNIYTVPTYQNTTCTTATSLATHTVQCVGSI